MPAVRPCRRLVRRFACPALLAGLLFSAPAPRAQDEAESAETEKQTPAGARVLPLPLPSIPDNPPLPPKVVTAGGQKLLLEHTDVTVRWNAERHVLETNRPGWWVINYPLERILGLEGQTPERIAQVLFGRAPAEVKNWYLRTPPVGPLRPAAEPPAPTGPAPIRPHARPTWIVDAGHARASDEGARAGSADSPFRSIGAAMGRAQPGDVIQVRPGTYRERLVARTPGRADAPIVLEGVRGPGGAMPVITGHDPAPAGAWSSVEGQPGLWRARAWTGLPGGLVRDGRLLRERTLAAELRPGEFLNNRGSRELAFPRLTPEAAGRGEGAPRAGSWERREVNPEGFLELGGRRGVYYLSTWLWLDPRDRRAGEVWDPRFPQPVTGNVTMAGGFRASRQSGSNFGSQLNPYRLWLNGEVMPAYGLAGEPRATTDYGQNEDKWERLPFKEGWNHLVIVADSAHSPRRPDRLRFTLPRGFGEGASSATAPEERGHARGLPRSRHITEWSVLGPIEPEQSGNTVMLRLAPGEDPDKLALELPARTVLATFDQSHWHVRGFEFRHGAQYQQQAQVTLAAPGVRFEHNLLREAEVRGLSFVLTFPQTEASMVARGNWVVSPGGLAMGATADTPSLAPDNLSSPPRRGRLLVDYNHLLDNNRAGYARFWESGAMKFFRLTGAVVRHNTIVEGDGPGIWYDWEHYNLRTEANLFIRPTAFAVGTEASPGPHLVANNVSIDLLPGGEWFRYALLGWSSARVWNVHNTIDNARDRNRGGWGIQYAEGPDSRRTRWGALTERDAAVVNNLVFRSDTTLHRFRARPVEGNLFYGAGVSGLGRNTRWRDTAYGAQVEASAQMRGGEALPPFNNPAAGDYRPAPGSRADRAGVERVVISSQGVETDIVGLVTHDFFGLPRHAADGRSAGAFRVEREPAAGEAAQLEVEFADGTLERRWRPASR